MGARLGISSILSLNSMPIRYVDNQSEASPTGPPGAPQLIKLRTWSDPNWSDDLTGLTCLTFPAAWQACEACEASQVTVHQGRGIVR
jgi:hypothetical protein